MRHDISMELNLSDFEATKFLINTLEGMQTFTSASDRSVTNGQTSKMSKHSTSLSKVASLGSKSQGGTKHVSSIFDCPILTDDNRTKKCESLKCYKCNKTFPSPVEVVMHLKLIHNACAFRDCSKISNFRLHSTVCVNRAFGCAVCSKTFPEKHLLLTHFNEHIDAAFYACEICREGFQQKKDLQKHFLETHNKYLSLPSTFAYPKTVYQKCSHCSKYFKLFAEFGEHVSSCNSPTYACCICKVGFTSLSALEDHKVGEHKNERAIKGHMALKQGKRYFCGLCYMGFYNGSILRKHLMTHETEVSYICDVCHISFACDNDLQTHYLQHIEEHYVLHDVISQHSCSTCMRTFKTQKELKAHLMLKNCKTSNKKLTSQLSGEALTNNYAKDLISNKENTQCNMAASENPEESMDSVVDISNILVYALKVGEDLLNCDDLQCVVVMDHRSLFVLQRGICAAEKRMPDVKNCEVYDESEVVDASLLENHMYYIFNANNENCNVDSEAVHDFQTSVDPSHLEQDLNSGTVETITLNIEESNDGSIAYIAFEDDKMQCESLPIGDCKNSENINEKYEFLVNDNANISESCLNNNEPSNKVIVQENKVPYSNEHIGNTDAVNKELIVEGDDAFSISGLFLCNICKQVFSSKASLSLHMDGNHTGFDCYHCGKSFSSEEELKSHERATHLSAFQCDLCEESYPKENLLLKHKDAAHGGKNFCNICDKSFALKNEYDVHMMIHKGETPPAKKEPCDKTYASMSNYVKQKTVFECKTPPKKYICTICERSFAAQSPLKAHLATHLRKSPFSYECPKCKIYFPPKVLAEHIESHVDVVL